MHPDQVKANMAINNTSVKRILFNICIIERYLEFKPFLCLENVNQHSFTLRYV